MNLQGRTFSIYQLSTSLDFSLYLYPKNITWSEKCNNKHTAWSQVPKKTVKSRLVQSDHRSAETNTLLDQKFHNTLSHWVLYFLSSFVYSFQSSEDVYTQFCKFSFRQSCRDEEHLEYWLPIQFCILFSVFKRYFIHSLNASV